MLWGNKKININNYSEVFKDYSKDVKEIIRSAILDDTPIEPYIGIYRNNPFMLWQVKMAIDEGLEYFWFDILSSGNTLCKLRELHSKGINIRPLKDYFSKGLSESHYNYIIKWYGEGNSLSKYNFEILPHNLLGVFDYGITLGYPMYLFNNGVNFSEEYIMCCLKILSNSKNISKLLNGEWNIENLELLSKFSKSKYYDKLIGYVTKDITPSVLEELYNCTKVGMPLECVSAIDSSGVYVYSAIQISIVREAYLDNLDYNKLLIPGASVNEINSILNSLKYNSIKKVSGRLRKN